MTYQCPKCGKPWLQWDGRAKVLICLGISCNHVIRIKNQKNVPSNKEILKAIKEDKGE